MAAVMAVGPVRSLILSDERSFRPRLEGTIGSAKCRRVLAGTFTLSSPPLDLAAPEECLTDTTPRIVARRTIFDGWNRFEMVTVEEPGPDGGIVRNEREVIDHGEAAVVLTYDPARQVALLVRQMRTPLLVLGGDPYLLEACAGIVDPGETPEDCARREAEEELGLRLGPLRFVQRVVPSAGTLTERMHLFLAEYAPADLSEDGGGNPHEGETIEAVEMPFEELFQMARSGRIEDAKTLILVNRLMLERAPALA